MAESDFQIVEADLSKPSHAEGLVALLDEYAGSLEGGGKRLAEQVRLNLPAEIARRPHAHALIAWMEERPVGLLIAFEGFSTFQCRPLLNIHDVIVSKDFRGKGISKRLFLAVEELARKLDCCKLTLEVLEHNQIAQKAYRGMGFRGYELDPRMGKAMFWEKKL